MGFGIASPNGKAPQRTKGTGNQIPFRGISSATRFRMRKRLTGRLRRQDSKLCISESEFAKTLSSGRAHSNMRISIEGCRVPPHCQRKFQAMIDPAADLIRNAEVLRKIERNNARSPKRAVAP